MTLKLYLMKCLERKISQCILPFTKNVFIWEKLLYRSPDYSENILRCFEDDDLSCTGKFCYRHRNFQNTEAATGSVLKNSN